jgi:hypothetical protein
VLGVTIPFGTSGALFFLQETIEIAAAANNAAPIKDFFMMISLGLCVLLALKIKWENINS